MSHDPNGYPDDYDYWNAPRREAEGISYWADEHYQPEIRSVVNTGTMILIRRRRYTHTLLGAAKFIRYGGPWWEVVTQFKDTE